MKSRSSRRVAELEAELAAVRQHAANLEADIERRIDNEAIARGRQAIADHERLKTLAEVQAERWPAYRSGYPSRVL